MGEPDATIVEALLSSAYPSSEVRWTIGPQVNVAGEWRDAVGAGYQRLPLPEGYFMAVSAIELPAITKAAVDQLQRFEGVSPGAAPTRLVVARVTADGTPVDMMVATLDQEAVATECIDLSVGTSGAASWPDVSLKYAALYGGEGWVGSIEWNTTLARDSLAISDRQPSEYWLKRSDGTETGGAVGMRRIDADTIELVIGGRTIVHQCEEGGCVVPAALVLPLD